MKKFTFLLKGALMLLCFLFSLSNHSQTCGSTISSFPYNEGFETGTGGWTQDAGDNFDWTRDSAGTPSGSTGPSTGNGASIWYMFTEASNPRVSGDIANFESPCFDLTSATSAQFSFYYHMYGVDMGTLNVDLSTDNGSTYPTNLWTISGQQHGSNGAAYTLANIDLTPYVGQIIKIRFSSTRGSGYRGDMAIDDIGLTAVIAPLPEIDITGLGTSISSGDTTPTTLDDTDFGNVDVTVGTNPNTFTINNSGTANLNLTGLPPYVVISGTNAADFTVTGIPITPVIPAGSTTFTITFNPSAIGLRTATVSIANNDADENPYTFDIQGNGTSTVQEINVTGLGNDISTGDITPSATDNTDFGTVVTAAGTSVSSFTIENLGTGSILSLTGASPYVSITGPNAADFTVTAIPSNSIAASSNTSFDITFDPSADGLRQATVTIANNDPDEGSYTFSIQGTGFTPPPCGNTVLHTADFEIGLEGWTDGGTDAQRVSNAARSYSNTYSLEIRNLDATGNNSSVLSPLFDFSSYDKVDFKFFFTSYNGENTDNFFVEYSNDSGSTWTIINDFICNDVVNKNADYESGNTIIFYSKTSTMFKSVHTFPAGAVSQIRVRSDGSDTTDLIYIDNVTITGTTYCLPTVGPGGITSNLDLWLRADKVDGTTVGTDGANVSKWTDTGKGNHAETVVSGQEPVYRNNLTKNINFNPVIEFENNNATSGSDMTYINTRDELKGTGGFNSNDIFIVVVPDPTITTTMIPLDTFTSTDPTGNTQNEDVTGFGYGSYTNRFTNELLTYCIGTTNGPGNGYGRASLDGTINYNSIGILNFRHNSGGTGEEIYLNATQIGTNTSDAPDFAAVNNTRYWLGRSQYWNGSFDGRIAEVITYDTRKTDGVTERNRIESYLAIKYGITLGVNGTSQNYINSSGNIIWDATANSGYSYDIAGIGRDDASDLNQKQSKSVNETSDGTGLLTGFLTMGLTDIYDTNSNNVTSNPTTFNNHEFLVWGNNGADITLPPFTVNVDMSAGISGLSTPVTFDGMQRIWKVVETGGDIPKVKISIPQNAVRNISPPGSYLMFISNTSVFDPTADYRVMTSDGFGNLETEYDFDGTKFITFGYAPEVVVERSVFFDGIQDYIDVGDHKDLNTAFTVSAWIKRTSATNDVSIFSKRDASFTEGYDFLIESGNRVEMIWNGGSDNIRGNTTIPQDEWHHVAVIYSGGTANLYIDGVLDKTETGLSNPTSTTQSFIIAAAGKTSTTAFFEGNIDEIRVWDVALSLDQLHYIMNQEIEENATFSSGLALPTTITKNEVGTIPWSDLAGYYPMSVYTYTNTNDQSNNSNQGALRNLNTVDFQTAPLPYGSNGSGSWDTATTWKNGDEQTIPGAASIVDPNVTIDWNIVSISHNITMDNASLPAANNNNRTLLGLIADSTKELTVSSDNGLTVTHYLELNGLIDLEGESQLIQSDKSVLTVGPNGSLERDQQGTSDLYTYNYWSSPVGVTNNSATNDTYTYSYTVPDVLRDGTNPASPSTITFLTGGVNGSPSPFSLADYWIWKFANAPDDDYSSWQHMRSTGTIFAGEGYTMKGPGTGTILAPQNYVFVGKPNNGDISLNISSGNDYLVGNPYPSAIDSHEFLTDNPDTSGTIYLWEHWGGGSHILWEYQGGYALYNYSGGIPTASYGTNDPDVATGGTPTKLPGRYIPVSQGFFVYSPGGGTINFENDQRVFEKEGASSVFMRSDSSSSEQPINYNEDTRMKFRIGFNSFNGIHRQLLLTVDEHASNGYDWGYDGRLNSQQIDDMFWMLDGERYGIQGVNEITAESVFPLAIHVRDSGPNSIQIDHLENVPENVPIFVRDRELNLYHDLRQSNYEFNLTAGDYVDRFEIVFFNRQSPLGTQDIELNNSFDVYYKSSSKNLIILNNKLTEINSIELYNIIGQSIFNSNEIGLQSHTEIKIPNLSTGTYIINLDTINGKLSKKVLVE